MHLSLTSWSMFERTHRNITVDTSAAFSYACMHQWVQAFVCPPISLLTKSHIHRVNV